MKEIVKRSLPVLTLAVFIVAPCGFAALVYHWISQPVVPSMGAPAPDYYKQPLESRTLPRAAHLRATPEQPLQQQPVHGNRPVSLKTFLENESKNLAHPLNSASLSPEGAQLRLNEEAAQLTLPQIRSLGRMTSASMSNTNLRALSLDLLARNGSSAALSAIEQSALSLKHVHKHEPLNDESRFEASLALWMIDTLAQQSDNSAAEASLRRLEHAGHLGLVRPYLNRVMRAVEAGKVREFYERQDRTLKVMAGIP